MQLGGHGRLRGRQRSGPATRPAISNFLIIRLLSSSGEAARPGVEPYSLASFIASTNHTAPPISDDADADRDPAEGGDAELAPVRRRAARPEPRHGPAGERQAELVVAGEIRAPCPWRSGALPVSPPRCGGGEGEPRLRLLAAARRAAREGGRRRSCRAALGTRAAVRQQLGRRRPAAPAPANLGGARAPRSSYFHHLLPLLGPHRATDSSGHSSIKMPANGGFGCDLDEKRDARQVRPLHSPCPAARLH